MIGTFCSDLVLAGERISDGSSVDVAFLDTPRRIIIEVVPEKEIVFDGGLMRDKTTETPQG